MPAWEALRALIDQLPPFSWISVPSGLLAWKALLRSRIAGSLNRTVAARIEVGGMSASLRQEGVSDEDRQQLIKAFWQKHYGLPDPSAR